MINGVEENTDNIITIQKYTKLHICTKCGYIPPAINNGSYHRDRSEEHIQNCEGKIKDHYV
jgi:hypothetical protein